MNAEYPNTRLNLPNSRVGNRCILPYHPMLWMRYMYGKLLPKGQASIPSDGHLTWSCRACRKDYHSLLSLVQYYEIISNHEQEIFRISLPMKAVNWPLLNCWIALNTGISTSTSFWYLIESLPRKSSCKITGISICYNL